MISNKGFWQLGLDYPNKKVFQVHKVLGKQVVAGFNPKSLQVLKHQQQL